MLIWAITEFFDFFSSQIYRIYISKVNEDKKGFWTLKYKYMYTLSKELPLKIPYSLVAEGQYKSAYEAFKVVLDTSTLNDLDKSEHFYFYLMAKCGLQPFACHKPTRFNKELTIKTDVGLFLKI